MAIAMPQDGLRGVADGVELGEDLRALLVDVAGHLGDALGVVGDGAEGVHRHDDVDGGQQATAGEGDEEQRQRRRAGTEERQVDRTGDDAGGEHGRLEADADAGEDHRGGAGQRGASDVDGRALSVPV